MMLMEASSLKLLEFSAFPPNKALIAEDALLLSPELVKGKIVAREV
jgi:hypothetical protein